MEVPLLAFYQIFDDVQELCYIFTHVFQVENVFGYFTKQAEMIKKKLQNKLLLSSIPFIAPKEIKENDSYSNYVQFHENLPVMNPTNHIKSQNHNIQKADEAISGPKTSTPCRKSSPASFNLYSQNDNLQCRVLLLEQEVFNLKKLIQSLSREEYPVVCEPQISFPPPPPPPLPPKDFMKRYVPLKKNPLKKRKITGIQNLNPTSKPSMEWILREIKDVKLKRTERSPGGTPMKQLNSCQGGDYGDLFKVALQKRFASINQIDWNNKENLSASFENSHSFS